jgi:AcrR family transcriptional regulator
MGTRVEAPGPVDTRQRLIDCAVEILDSDGLAGLGLREVARRAGVSHNAPSRHFPGGYRDLCTAVATIGFAGLARALDAGTDAGGTDPFARLAGNGRGYVQFGVAHRGLFELMWRRDLIDFGDPDLVAAAGAAYASLRNCVVAAQAAGWQRAADTDVLAATCWAWAQGVSQLWSQGALPGPLGPVDLDVLVREGLLAFAITH